MTFVKQPVVHRFISKCEREPSGCILWTGTRDRDGYGTFWLRGKNRRATQISLELFAGIETSYVLHLCDNPPCVNPEHLVSGDHQENQRQRRLCECGECRRCRHRDYMREWSRRNAEKVRARVRAYHREKRSTA